MTQENYKFGTMKTKPEFKMLLTKEMIAQLYSKSSGHSVLSLLSSKDIWIYFSDSDFLINREQENPVE